MFWERPKLRSIQYTRSSIRDNPGGHVARGCTAAGWVLFARETLNVPEPRASFFFFSAGSESGRVNERGDDGSCDSSVVGLRDSIVRETGWSIESRRP